MKKLLAAAVIMAATSFHIAAQNYTWNSVPIVGGGFVSGIVMHPTKPGLRYCRTDMGGAYRWDKEQGCWIQLLDWLGMDDNNLQGVESIAVDPNNPDALYMACGTNQDSPVQSILISHDRGKSFRRVDVPFSMSGNGNGRGNGERMMVDPTDGKIIYMGTRSDGLWRSTDRGESWHPVLSFPDITPIPDPETVRGHFAWHRRPVGIVAVQFYISPAGEKTIFAAVSLMGRDNLYMSADGGESWQPVPGHPQQYMPTHMAVSTDGALVLTYADNPGPWQPYDGAVWKYDISHRKWTDISPIKIKKGEKAGFGYLAVSVDPRNPKHMICSTHYLGGNHGYRQEELFHTMDGGKSWQDIYNGHYTDDASIAPYAAIAPLHWMFDIEIDPFNSDHALTTSGFGGWETHNLTDISRGEDVRFSLMSRGIEETVPLSLYAPPSGVRIISGVGDYGGFTHESLTEVDRRGTHANPYFANCNSVTGAWLIPELIVRSGTPFQGQAGAIGLSYSTDGGRSWTMAISAPEPDSRNGNVAVSADGSAWIWTPDRKLPYLTTDRGASWTPCTGLPKGIRVEADKVNPDKFYAVDVVARRIYRSTDAGRSFTADSLVLPFSRPVMKNAMGRIDRGDTRGGQDRIYTVPGREGDIWLAAYDGLYRSPDIESLQFSHLDKVTEIHAFGLGVGPTPEAYPSLYLIGTVNGQYGFFRSDDQARTWERINDDTHQYGKVLLITGDWHEHGRAYVGTHGRGLITGAPDKH